MNFPFICSNIPAVPTYGVYISQLIQCSELALPIMISLTGVADNKEATRPKIPSYFRRITVPP